MTNLPEHRGALRLVDVRRRHLLHAGHHRSRTPVWREVFDDTIGVEGDRPARGRGRRLRRWRLGADQRRRPLPVPRRDRPGPGLARRRPTPARPRWSTSSTSRSSLAAGTGVQCNIDTITEVYDGGDEADCPISVDALEVPGQHLGWPALGRARQLRAAARRHLRGDPRRAAASPCRTTSCPARASTATTRSAWSTGPTDGQLSASTGDFIDENEGTPCIDFNRTVWPHGAAARRSRTRSCSWSATTGSSVTPPLTAASTSDAPTTDLAERPLPPATAEHRPRPSPATTEAAAARRRRPTRRRLAEERRRLGAPSST